MALLNPYSISDTESTVYIPGKLYKKCGKYAINNINAIDVSKVMKYLEILNNKLLYKKVGFVLEKYKEVFNISDEFFFECKKRSGNTIGYYNLHAKDSLIFNAKWRLFVYKDMEEF